MSNFFNNHQELIYDNDVFCIVVSLYPRDNWMNWLKSLYSEQTIRRMKDNSDRRNCLDFDDPTEEILREIWNASYARPALVLLLRCIISKELNCHPIEQFESDTFAQKIREVQVTLKLSDFETDVLLVLAFLCDNYLCLPELHEHRSDKPDFIAKCLDCDVASVRDALRDDGKLRRYGCIDEDFDFLVQLIGFLNGVSKEPLTNSYYTLFQGEVLPWDFYGDLVKKHGEILKRMFAGNQTLPTNILLYGAPGTGKTSFAMSLAAELKRDCYMIAQNVCGRREPARSTPEYRFGALQVCAEQVAPADSIIIIDEADRMLRANDGMAFLNGGGGQTGDKGLLNSVLDSIRVPTIWIANTPAEMLDESSRRRFDYSIRFDPLNNAQRLAIWCNNVAKMHLKHLISSAMMLKFATIYPVSAGGITMTLRNLAKLAPRKEEVEPLVEKLMKQHCELLGIQRKEDKMLPSRDYSIKGLNIKGKIPLDRMVDAIRNFQRGIEGGFDRPRMNLLLSGPPGSGKTEFVKYLGAELHTKIVVKMGGDLLNMYVGGTEQNISRAFRKAESERAILFLDEIDGLVQSRERAARSWEVTQVNELLHQMENFNGVMIGATNFPANLDPAVLRRFTFKLEFDYLDEAGKKLFFERMFHSKLSKKECRELAAIPMLAPGDFRTVRQSFFYLGVPVGNRDYIEALARESEAKTANRFTPKSPIGF